MPNRLIDEQSLYLQQHARNPVDWYPWGDEAFTKAKEEQKPVLVSIGYAACHWCHVMERESFESEEVAAYMNEHYVCIKVDREEHPDVDHMYMDAVQAIAGNGGWPLNVFVTPERMPFYGGTYFPPRAMYGRLSWMEILERIKDIWDNSHDQVEMQTSQMTDYLKQISTTPSKGGEWTTEACKQMAANMLQAADKEKGGFGKAPKFPATMSIQFLLEHYHYTGNKEALEHALFSLDSMIQGGIYDQIGGGFSRYSVDDEWLVPHFEKMLYDNALLVSVMSDAYMISSKEIYKETIEQTIDFINRELKDEAGGFYSALDADSEGVEGKFYTWKWDEWENIVGGSIATEYYGVSEQGNWEGTNILNVRTSIEELSAKTNKQVSEVKKELNDVQRKLLEIREKRIRPALDDKSLLGWNALMNIALTKASRALQKEEYTEQAVSHMQWMIATYKREDKWLHTSKNGEAKIDAKLDDLAYLLHGMLMMDNSRYEGILAEAVELLRYIERYFLHEDKSFFYYTSSEQKDLPVRKADIYDGAIPSANAMMAYNLLLCGIYIGSSAYTEQAQYLLNNMQQQTVRYPTSFGMWGVFAQRATVGMKCIVLSDFNTSEMKEMLFKNFLPHVIILTVQKVENELAIFENKKGGNDGRAYVCDVDSCLPPLSDIEDLLKCVRKQL